MSAYTVFASLFLVSYHLLGSTYYASGTVPTTHQFGFNMFCLGLAVILVVINLMTKHLDGFKVKA